MGRQGRQQSRLRMMMRETMIGKVSCALVVLLALLAPLSVKGAIHGYSREPFTNAGNGAYIFRGGREGLFASTEAPSSIHTVNKKVSDGRSYIRLANLEFKRSKKVSNAYRMLDGDTGLVEALIFEVRDRELIGHVMDDGSRRFCCSEDLASKIRCKKDRLIVKEHSDGQRNTPWVYDINFRGNETIAQAEGPAALPITDTGMYHLWFMACNPELKGLKVEGQTTWKNPHGYLPGMMAPFLDFYGYMSLAMLALGFVWFGLYAFHWQDIIPLQHCISVLIFLAMLEVFVWYFDFVNFNVSGFRPYVTTLWAVLLGSLRKSAARILVLVVSMGYGVVRPTLGGISTQVQGLGIAYFIAAAVLDIITHVGTIDDLPSMLRVLMVMPVASLDAVTILWVFVSLSKTLTQLSARKQTTKLNLYRAFTNTLAIAVWVSICWTAYEMYFKISDSTNTEKWESYWVTDAFWQILTFAVMTVICVLWRPSKNSQCYDYSEADGDLFAEENSTEMREVNTDVFSIDDDQEGDAGEKMS